MYNSVTNSQNQEIISKTRLHDQIDQARSLKPRQRHGAAGNHPKQIGNYDAIQSKN